MGAIETHTGFTKTKDMKSANKDRLKRILAFLKTKTFRLHFGLSLAATIAILWFGLKFLDIYTMHGRTIMVPDLMGLQEAEVKKIVKEKRLRYMVTDSIYDNTREKGSIANQDPAPHSEVKKNRTIYLTMVAKLPEMVAIPDLSDLSLRQAVAILNSYGLKVGRLEYVPDIARNAVLRQKMGAGMVEPGTLVEKGTAIDLVLGSGLSAESVQVPWLIGKSRQDASMMLNSLGLNVGSEIFTDNVEDHTATVFEQNPGSHNRKSYLSVGSSVDLWYKSSANFDFNTYISELKMVLVPILYGKTRDEALRILEASGLKIENEVFEKGVKPEDARVFSQEPDNSNDAYVPVGTAFKLYYRALKDFELNLD